MATHKQAEKRHRQSLKKNARNIAVKSRLRSLVRELRDVIVKKNRKDAEAKLPLVASALDAAADKGVLPKKRAARQISRLSHAIHGL